MHHLFVFCKSVKEALSALEDVLILSDQRNDEGMDDSAHDLFTRFPNYFSSDKVLR